VLTSRFPICCAPYGRFIDQEERAAGKASTGERRPASDSSLTKERHQESAAAEETKPKTPITYKVSEQPSALVQEEEFAKQLRLAPYLAAASLPPSRPLEPVREVRTPKQARPVTKARPKIKTPSASKKAREEELAKERRRAGKVARQRSLSSASHRGEKQRQSHDR
jgi:hypothetical protein